MIKIFQSVYLPILFIPVCSIICLNSKCFLVLVAQSCQTLCNPMDCSPPGSSVHWILQARILEQLAILFSRGSSWPRDQTGVFCLAGNSLLAEPASGKHCSPLLFTRQSSKNLNKNAIFGGLLCFIYHINIIYFLQQYHKVGFLFQVCTNRESENDFSQGIECDIYSQTK